MAVSKRLRYEILRRDGHACHYCGASAPDVKLTVDHVIPATLGGRDGPENLVAACGDCNAGKSSSVPDGPTIADVAMAQAEFTSAKRDVFEQQETEKAIKEFRTAWYRGTLPSDWERSIEVFVEEGLTAKCIACLAAVAQNKQGQLGWRWAYFCGCCWNRIRKAQDRVAAAPPAPVPAVEPAEQKSDDEEAARNRLIDKLSEELAAMQAARRRIRNAASQGGA